MARIRTVKPRLFSSGSLARCSIPARLLFVGLFTEADDEGRLLGSPKRLAGNLFPHDEGVTAAKVGHWLAELEAVGCIQRYTAEGVEYLYLPGFEAHQRISHPTPSQFPNPSGNGREPLVTGSRKLEVGTGNREVGTGIAPQAPARETDPNWEAFCDVTGVDWHDLSTDRRGALNGMLKSLRQRGADTEEIRRRAANWPWDVPITPEGLTKRWAELGAARRQHRDPIAEQGRRLGTL
jgi:hypothetical protein